VGALRLMRTVTASAAAVVEGLVNVASGRGERSPVQLKPGDAAPQFDLPASDGRRYRLSDLTRDNTIVIAWFPKAFTGGCTMECESLGSHRVALQGFRARYFGASVDAPETNRRFAESLGITFPILSDEEKRVARAYGVLGAAGFAARWTFYIGTDGRILDIDKSVHASSHGADVARKLAELHTPRL
jgi:thioredoxin-dependent peroxiredoxin